MPPNTGKPHFRAAKFVPTSSYRHPNIIRMPPEQHANAIRMSCDCHPNVIRRSPGIETPSANHPKRNKTSL
eukprot:14102460-Alexandrium_andersonii.AAC.1